MHSSMYYWIFLMIKQLYKQFSDWMNFNPPGALTSRGWHLFNKEYRQEAPIRYWFHRDFRRNFILPVIWKKDEIKGFIRYRTYDRYHILKTGLKPGYQGVEQQMLHVSFNLLKDFIEVETAWHTYVWSDDPIDIPTRFEKYMPFYRVFYPFRRPDLGIKHLEWASKLDDPSLPPHERSEHQAIAAREIHALYNWWVNIRPNRKSIDIVFPKAEIEDEDDIFGGEIDRNSKEYKEFRKKMKTQEKLEKVWEKEDDKMFIRLIKVRHHLWT